MERVKQLADVKYPIFNLVVENKELGVKRLILNWEKADQKVIDDYVELKELLGWKLHYIEPCLYAGENDYCAIFLYFIDDVGNQKVLMIDADEFEPNKVKMLLMV